jgi:putative ABC transport system permease protein
VISNTFAILVAQRTRELALLRAVGANRRQILTSVLLEAVLVGLIAAAIGLGAGILLAKLVITALSSGGADLPTTSIVVRPNTVVIALLIGLLVTLVAAVLPAIKATRVPPLAALRDVAIDRSGASRVRLVLGAVVLLIGGFALSAAWTSDGNTDALPTVGLGAVLVIVAAIVVGPVLAGPSVKAIGSPLPRVKGVTGRVATENAARSPKRTSATASALVIGVALVGFITVFAASAKESIVASIQESFSGDFVIQSSSGFGFGSGFPTEVADQAAAVDGVASVTPLGFGIADIVYPNGDSTTFPITAVDPESLLDTLDPKMEEGQLTDLTDDGMIMDRQLAKDHDVSVGDEVKVTLAGGQELTLEVQAISDEPNLLGNFIITRGLYTQSVPQLLDNYVYGRVDDGADLDQVVSDVDEAVSGTPSLKVLDRDGFADDLVRQVTSFVNIIYGLLALSIIVAMIGIANTLSLSINERTRELGLLRAVGMNRSQLRSAIRWEAVLISVLGTLVGLGLGLVLSRVVLKALEGQGLTEFTIPFASLVVITLAAAALGTLASILPARRAARMPILDAIATE